MEITLNTPLIDFPGVGEVRAKKLEKLGLVRCADLISYFPRDYEDRRQVCSIRSAPLGQKVCISAMAAEHPRRSPIRKGLELVKLKVVDQAGPCTSPSSTRAMWSGPSGPERNIFFTAW